MAIRMVMLLVHRYGVAEQYPVAGALGIELSKLLVQGTRELNPRQSRAENLGKEAVRAATLSMVPAHGPGPHLADEKWIRPADTN